MKTSELYVLFDRGLFYSDGYVSGSIDSAELFNTPGEAGLQQEQFTHLKDYKVITLGKALTND